MSQNDIKAILKLGAFLLGMATLVLVVAWIAQGM